MRRLNTFGIATAATLAVFAFTGASGASAASICIDKNAKVTGGQIICTANAFLLKILGLAKLPKIGPITCSSVTVHAVLHIKILSIRISGLKLLWSLCTQKGQPCDEKVTVESPGEYEGEIHYVDKTYGTPEEGESTFLVNNPETVVKFTNCFLVGNVTCKYLTNETLEGTGNNGAMTLSFSQNLSSPGGICPGGNFEAVSSIEMGTPEGEEEGSEGDLVLVGLK